MKDKWSFNDLDQWFMEEPMDQRPYMRAIEEIARWIVENSDEDDKIVAWHCYALEANRETLMEISCIRSDITFLTISSSISLCCFILI